MVGGHLIPRVPRVSRFIWTRCYICTAVNWVGQFLKKKTTCQIYRQNNVTNDRKSFCKRACLNRSMVFRRSILEKSSGCYIISNHTIRGTLDHSMTAIYIYGALNGFLVHLLTRYCDMLHHYMNTINPILPGGDSAPLVFFFHHPETPQAIKLKLSDFKDTSLRHILQVIPVRYILRCNHGNKLQKVPCKIWLSRKVKFLNNSVLFTDIELEFGMETNFGPLNSKSNINLEFDVIVTFSAF